MGLLRKLLGTPSKGDDAGPDAQVSPPWPPPVAGAVVGGQPVVYRGGEVLQVVGESRHQDELWSIVGGRRTADRVRHECHAVLLADDDNEYDPNAIAVWVDGLHIGYLSREDAASYRPGLLRLAANGPVALCALVAGGGHGGEVALLGVFLEHEPADFGLEPSGTPPRQIRTGLGEAFATDRDDDSYDLSWFTHLPDDHRSAATQLARLLRDERDPIDRHYMLCELEARLYRIRDHTETALAEFDDVCRQHDAEMGQLRSALIAKFGGVPLLEVYKQQCIRQQKARNWTTGTWWAERGIEAYGADALSQDWVDDLKKRAAYLRGKLDLENAPKPVGPSRIGMTPSSTDSGSTFETLICGQCGREWQRAVVRGRKPHVCDDCRRAV